LGLRNYSWEWVVARAVLAISIYFISIYVFKVSQISLSPLYFEIASIVLAALCFLAYSVEVPIFLLAVDYLVFRGLSLPVPVPALLQLSIYQAFLLLLSIAYHLKFRKENAMISALTVASFHLSPASLYLLPSGVALKRGLKEQLLASIPLVYLYFVLGVSPIKGIIVILLLMISSLLFSLRRLYSASGSILVFTAIYMLTNSIFSSSLASLISIFLNLYTSIEANTIGLTQQRMKLASDKSAVMSEISVVKAVLDGSREAQSIREVLDYSSALDNLRSKLETCKDQACIQSVQQELESVKENAVKALKESLYSEFLYLKDLTDQAKSVGLLLPLTISSDSINVRLDNSLAYQIRIMKEERARLVGELQAAAGRIHETAKRVLGKGLENTETSDPFLIIAELRRFMNDYSPQLSKCVDAAYEVLGSIGNHLDKDIVALLNKSRLDFVTETSPVIKLLNSEDILKRILEAFSGLNALVSSTISKVYTQLGIDFFPQAYKALPALSSSLGEDKSYCERINIIRSFLPTYSAVMETYNQVRAMEEILPALDAIIDKFKEEIQNTGCVNVAEYGIRDEIFDLIYEVIKKRGLKDVEVKERGVICHKD
jgi:phospholipid N-methyltransferase